MDWEKIILVIIIGYLWNKVEYLSNADKKNISDLQYLANEIDRLKNDVDSQEERIRDLE